jgi:hypothetical protein
MVKNTVPESSFNMTLPNQLYFRLISDLNDDDPARRMSALHELGVSCDARLPGPVTRRIFDTEPVIRERASCILEQFGLGVAATAITDLYRDGPVARGAAVAALRPLLDEAMPAPHVAVIAITAAGLHELFDSVAAAGVVHANRFVRRAAIEGLYQVNQPRLAPVFLIPSADADSGVRRYAAVGLAENSVLVGARRLCYDRDETVANAARQAFARPGAPTLVRDPHRRVMNTSQSFSLPDCGSPTMRTARFPRLAEVARSLVQQDDWIRAEMSVVTLLRLGRSRQDVRALLADNAPRALLRRVSAPTDKREPSSSEPTDPKLVGKRVLLVGGDGIEGPLVEALGEAGLDVQWIGGFDNRAARLAGASFDAVLILTKRVSHANSEHAIRIGEAGGAVVVHVQTLGKASVLDAAREALV